VTIKKTVLKIAFSITLILYIGIIGIWCYRFPISYKLTNGSYHDLVVDHDFTQQEREGLEEAYRIRQIVSNVLLFSSILVSVGSYICLRSKWIRTKTMLKIIMYISGFIALVLILINGIHFMPGPPIR
jgi:hypothetical protein